MTVARLLYKLSLAENGLNHPELHSAEQLVVFRRLKRNMRKKLKKLGSNVDAGNPLGLKVKIVGQSF